MEIKTQKLSMPTNARRLADLVLLLLRMPRLQMLRVTAGGIDVARAVEADEPIVPETLVELSNGVMSESVDLDILLKTILVEALPFDPERHQLTTLVQMVARVRDKGLFPCDWYAPEGDGLDAFLGQAEGTLPAELFGIAVHYVKEDQLPENRLLLVGAETRASVDARYGITADMGR
jgi:hypothetical protein